MLSRVARVGKREDSRAVVLVNRRGFGSDFVVEVVFGNGCSPLVGNEIGNFPN